jgi:hypothetical protein
MRAVGGAELPVRLWPTRRETTGEPESTKAAANRPLMRTAPRVLAESSSVSHENLVMRTQSSPPNLGEELVAGNSAEVVILVSSQRRAAISLTVSLAVRIPLRLSVTSR